MARKAKNWVQILKRCLGKKSVTTNGRPGKGVSEKKRRMVLDRWLGTGGPILRTEPAPPGKRQHGGRTPIKGKSSDRGATVKNGDNGEISGK